MFESVTPEIAATTLWSYDIDTNVKVEPGDWRKCLLTFIGKSDVRNRRLLGTIYPGEVIACELVESGDVQQLIRIAQRWSRP